MAVPGYQEFMLPLLKLAADGQEHTVSEAMRTIAAQMNISEADRQIELASGQTRFYNRVMWAETYLVKSLLITKTGRARFVISERGKKVLAENPSRVDNRYLERFPEYLSFKSKRTTSAAATREANPDDEESNDIIDVTPDERLEVAHQELRSGLQDDLLERVRSASPRFFEHLVIDVLVAMGYGGTHADAAQVVGKSGDGGIDGVIKEDRLGLDMIYVQAKRLSSDVGPAAIREFVGSLGERRASKGVFITCGGFTSGAREAAARAHFRIVLIDGPQLGDFMIDHGVGVTQYKQYTVKRVDTDYFEEAES